MEYMEKDFRRLIRMAFITSPILAIYNAAPISLFLNSGMISPEIRVLPQIDNPIGIFLPIFFITFNALVIWLFNIWLVKKTLKMNLTSGVRYLLSFLFILLLFVTISSITSQVRSLPSQLGVLKYYPLVGTAANNVFILIMIDLVLSRGKRAALEIEKANLQSLNLKARHEQLKQQIQPHFLFNALNTLKLLIKKRPDAAEMYTVRLSSFLRTSISDGLEEKLSIKEDLEIFENFMELQKVRFPDAIEYSCTISPETLTGAFLPAFTFQTLAENAIKHNGFNVREPLRIEISEVESMILFTNNMIPRNQEIESTGIGLKNLSERFQIISGGDIQIEKNEESFLVKIKAIQT